MNRTRWTLLLLVSGCAHAGTRPDPTLVPNGIWREAHDALSVAQYARADTLFTRLWREHPATGPGRESLFYLGSLRLDPRNPGWDPQRSESALRDYLAIDTAGTGPILRRPEGETLYQIAQQLNLPPEERIEGLQTEPRVVVRRVAPARETGALAAEVRRLRQQVAERDAQIRRQNEELERIRKTLTGSGPRE